MAIVPNVYAFEVKHIPDSDKALRSRGEMGLSNLTVGNSNVPLETFNKDCFGVVLDKDRRKAYVLIRANVIDSDDAFNYASDIPDLYASTSAIGLL